MVIKNYEKILENALISIKDDYTELWFLFHIIEKENPHLNFSELTGLTLIVIRDLMEKHNVKMFNDQTMKPMNLSVEDALYFVKNLLFTLKRHPTVGDGIWFT